MSITEKAQLLADEIVETTEYKEMVSAEKKVHEDETASSLIEDFQSLQKRLQMSQSNGKQISTKQQKKMQTLQNKMNNNPLIKTLLEKQKSFNQVMQTVNQVIGSNLAGNN